MSWIISLEYAKTNEPIYEHLEVTYSSLLTSLDPIMMSVSESVMNMFLSLYLSRKESESHVSLTNNVTLCLSYFCV
jgi:hypothetical protein